MRITLATLLLLTCAFSARAELAAKDDSIEPVKSIPVVKTWKDLLKSPVIQLKDGQTVRLGIEAQKVPHGSTPLLYLCVENYRAEIGSPDQLGPLSVKLEGPAATDDILRAKLAEKLTDEHAGDYALFAKPLVIDKAGEYRVTLSVGDMPEGTKVAEFKIQGTDAEFPRWLPIGDDIDGAQAVASGDAEFNLTGPAGGSAYPKMLSHLPVAFRKKSADGDERLPFLLDAEDQNSEPKNLKPDDATAAERWFADLAAEEFETREKATEKLAALGAPLRPLLIRLKQSSADPESKMRAGMLLRRLENFIIEKTSHGIQIRMNTDFIISECEHHFLARWWINGKPLSEVQRKEEKAQELVEEKLGNSLHLNLNLGLETLGAKPGDKIGIQLLYCPSGIEHVDYQMQQQMERAGDGTLSAPAISNKLEFTAEAK